MSLAWLRECSPTSHMARTNFASPCLSRALLFDDIACKTNSSKLQLLQRFNPGTVQSPPCPLEFINEEECTYRPPHNKESKSNVHGSGKSPYKGIRVRRHHGQHHCFGEGFSTHPKTGCICFGKRSSDRHELENIVFQVPKKNEQAKILALVGTYPCKAFRKVCCQVSFAVIIFSWAVTYSKVTHY